MNKILCCFSMKHFKTQLRFRTRIFLIAVEVYHDSDTSFSTIFTAKMVLSRGEVRAPESIISVSFDEKKK